MTSTGRPRAAAGRLLLSGVPVVSLTYLYTVLWVGIWLVLGVVVLGFTPVAITSGSMAPAIRAGDVVLQAPPDPESLGPPNVVTFPDPGQPARTVTHRIIGMNPDGTLRTRGDANPAADSDPVDPAEIRGVGRLLLPWAALPALWARTGQVTPLVLWLAGTLLAVAAAGRSLRAGPPHAAVVRRPAAGGRTGSAGRPAPAVERAALHAPTPWTARREPRGRVRGGEAGTVGVRGGRAAAATMAVLAGLMSLNLVLPPSQAAFASATANATNSFAAVTVAPPTDVTGEFDCGLLGIGKGVIVSWTASVTAEADGYEIWRAVGTGSFSLLTTVGAATTSYKDTDVQNSTTYHYLVRTTAGSWTSGDSDQVSVTTPGTLACPL